MRERMLGLLALILVLAAVLATTWLQQRQLAETAYAPEPSSFNASPPGLKAFYTYLLETGRPVQRWVKPLRELTSTSVTPDVVIITTPSKVAPSQSDCEALARWISTGGALIYLADFSFPYGPSARELHRQLDLPIESRSVTLFRLSEVPIGSASPALPYPLLDGIAQLSTQNTVDLVHAAENSVTLFADDLGPVVLYRKLWRGSLYIVRSSASMSNRMIGRGENMAFWQRVVDLHAGQGGVAFVEYYHGYAASEAVSLWSRGDVRLAAAQVGLLALVYLLAAGGRFGSRRRLHDHARRSSMEYVASLADLYRRAGAQSHVRERMRAGLLEAARCRFGLAEDATPREISRALASHFAATPEAVAALLEAPERQDLLAWTREVGRMTAELQSRAPAIAGSPQ